MEINYTVTQAAGILNRSARTVRNLITAGRLRAIEVGTGDKRKHFSIPQSALEEFERRASQQAIQTCASMLTTAELQTFATGQSFSRYTDRAVRAQGR